MAAKDTGEAKQLTKQAKADLAVSLYNKSGAIGHALGTKQRMTKGLDRIQPLITCQKTHLGNTCDRCRKEKGLNGYKTVCLTCFNSCLS